jgi:LacI family transcriptional regulator
METFLAGGAALPTAVLAHNGLMALGAMTALCGAGRAIPEDVSIIGDNDRPMVGHLSPPLTTIQYPGFAVVREAAATLIGIPAGEPVESSVLTPRLVVRASTAPPRLGA